MRYSVDSLHRKIQTFDQSVLMLIGERFQVRQYGHTQTDVVLREHGDNAVVGYYNRSISKDYLTMDIEMYLNSIKGRAE